MLKQLLLAGLFAGASMGQMFTKGQKFQIILSAKPDTSKNPLPPVDAPVWDIDLFENEAKIISDLKAQGRVVICYFSAGTWEDWREDAKDFPDSDKGKVLPEWPNEKWIRVSSQKVRDIMSKRIKLASDKGCDAIDPDNTDGYQNDNGLNLKNTDLIDYMSFLQRTASGYGMKIGLKNSLDILPSLSSIVDFAVNEQCAQLNECAAYRDFLATNKPVFQIEYPTKFPIPDNERRIDCSASGMSGMSTVMKNLTLGGYTVYCDGSIVDTPVTGGTNWHPKPPKSTGRPWPPPFTRRSTSIRPTSTRTRPTSSTVSTSSSTSTSPSSTSSEPTSPPTSEPTSSSSSSTFSPTSTLITSRPTSTRPSSTARPTTSAPPTGCQQKHWDQCGGNDWKGCTVCAAPYQCKGVSPPWYYQCL